MLWPGELPWLRRLLARWFAAAVAAAASWLALPVGELDCFYRFEAIDLLNVVVGAGIYKAVPYECICPTKIKRINKKFNDYLRIKPLID